VRCRVRVHFKVLANPTTAPLATHIQDTKDLFATSGIVVERVTVENLTAPDPALNPLRDLDVGDCLLWPLGLPSTSDAQNTLFEHRNNVRAGDLVVYIVRTILYNKPGKTLAGCATHPPERPGCVVVRSAARYVVAHELGHVLGLGHVANRDQLMYESTSWTNPPPDIAPGEASWMRGNDLVWQCP
jgi:hypothetical protein